MHTVQFEMVVNHKLVQWPEVDHWMHLTVLLGDQKQPQVKPVLVLTHLLNRTFL